MSMRWPGERFFGTPAKAASRLPTDKEEKEFCRLQSFYWREKLCGAKKPKPTWLDALRLAPRSRHYSQLRLPPDHQRIHGCSTLAGRQN
jgi:hypothetical protein